MATRTRARLARTQTVLIHLTLDIYNDAPLLAALDEAERERALAATVRDLMNQGLRNLAPRRLAGGVNHARG